MSHGHFSGGRMSPTYSSWNAMKTRCLNPNRADYKHYGGRGIKIYNAWLDFKNFLRDMGERPDGLELDRIDVNGNYEPGNCRWATRTTQVNNSRVRKDNVSGLKGVTFKRNRKDFWWAYHGSGGNGQELLYRGNDFFEACCARKSWEAKQLGQNPLLG